ncbi:hypothetical protein JMJ56_22960 [Belnapia sp. T18]|uniref:Uncharacterized protein n=1 Tax=Belnapia arida TaxID=2804533 RepID=A0ABS1U8A0_9PROT|nr:hypothetical protein [Belnapia arida]MBL6080878.1 hypothetical protein [Belnapia arida]
MVIKASGRGWAAARNRLAFSQGGFSSFYIHYLAGSDAQLRSPQRSNTMLLNNEHANSLARHQAAIALQLADETAPSQLRYVPRGQGMHQAHLRTPI